MALADVLTVIAQLKGKMLAEGENAGAFARVAEVRLKAHEQLFRLCGMDMRKTTSGNRLETADDIRKFYLSATQSLKSALADLEKKDPEEAKKARECLEELRKQQTPSK